jgi:hypothetical protein
MARIEAIVRLRDLFRREHDARYNSPAVHYTFAFSLPRGADIYKLTETLLRRDLASAAGSVIRGIRYAHRYQTVQKNRALAETLSTLKDVEEGEGKLIHWMARHPRTAYLLLRKKIIRITRSKERDKPNPELIKIYEEFGKIPTELDDKMAEAGLILGSQLATDELLFNPDYLSDEPFIRLDLDSVFVECDDFADPEVLMSLLLHQSGVALLTFSATPGENRTTDDLLSVSSSNQVAFTKTILDESLGKLIGHANKDRVVEDEWKESEGIRWRETSWREPLPLQELFQAYSDLIISNTRGRSTHSPWMCYTTLFVDSMMCCDTRTKWLDRHRLELAGLIGRRREYANSKPSYVTRLLAAEQGIRSYESKYFGPGNAVIVRWDFERETTLTSLTDQFPTIAIVQSALLQYWQLLALDARFVSTKWKSSDLASIQRLIIAGLDEYRGAKLMWEEAIVEENEITNGLGVDRLYARILDRLGAIDQLMTARSTQVGARRNLLIAALGSFATLLLGLPAIRDLLNIVRQLDTSIFPGILLRPLASFAADGPAGAWNLYVVLIGVAAAVLAISVLMRVRDVRKERRGEFGLGWDVTYEVIPPNFSKGRVADQQVERSEE